MFWPYVWRGLGDMLIALPTPLPIALVLLFTYGVGTSTGGVTYSTILQRRVPDAVRGRVFATLDVVWATGEIASIGMAGILVDHVGIVVVYLGGGALLMLAGALGLLLPQTRNPERPQRGSGCHPAAHTSPSPSHRQPADVQPGRPRVYPLPEPRVHRQSNSPVLAF